MSESLLEVIVIILLVGIGMISFSTVGFSLKAYQNKPIWSGFSKWLCLIGLIITFVCSIVLII